MKKIILIATTLLMTSVVTAQKFGHINTQQILITLPDYQQANIDLENFAKEKMAEFEQYRKLYEEKEKTYLEKEAKHKANPDSYPADLLKQDYKKIMESAQKLEELQYEMEGEIQERENILLNAIISKIKTTCEQIAKEKGYLYIFDTSSVLYAGGDDLNETVKAKLNK
jgi:outer membrane protein